MSESEPASDQVTIRCPACGKSEAADPAVLADSPMIVCRNCGETWPVAPRRTKRPAFATTQHDPRPALIEAERRPLITFSDGAEKAWAATIEGDILPEAPQASRFAATATTTASLAAILFVGALLGGREAAVAALPDLAGLYAAVGLPVNLDGLAIEDVKAERLPPEEGSKLTVRGLIRNVSGVDRAARPLVVKVMDAVARGIGSRDFDPPAATIAAGDAVPFMLEFQELPEEAAEISIRFRRPFETLHYDADAP